MEIKKKSRNIETVDQYLLKEKNKPILKKTMIEVFQDERPFLRALIKKFPETVPNIFEEWKEINRVGGNLSSTKFNTYWNNKRTKLLKFLEPESNEIIKHTKTTTIEEKDNCKVINKNNNFFYTINFKTREAAILFKKVNANLNQIKKTDKKIKKLIDFYSEKIEKEPEKAGDIYKEVAIYEKLHKIQSEGFNNTTTQLMQIKLIIENERALFENNNYIKQAEEQKQGENQEITDLINKITEQMNTTE